MPAGADARDYRFVLRNQLPADGLELVVELPAGFDTDGRIDGTLLVDRVARLHRGGDDGDAHRGSIDFDVLPLPR